MTVGDLALLALGLVAVFVCGVLFGRSWQARVDEDRYTRRSW